MLLAACVCQICDASTLEIRGILMILSKGKYAVFFFAGLLATVLVPLCECQLYADDVRLELVYRVTDVLPESWYLTAEVIDTGTGANGSYGIASVHAFVDNVLFDMYGYATSVASGIGALDPIDPGGSGERPAVLETLGGTIDIFYQQDLLQTNQSVVSGVGVGGPALIASGGHLSFGGSFQPGFGDDDLGNTSTAYFLDSASGPFGSQVAVDNIIFVVTSDIQCFCSDLTGDGFVDGLDLGVLLGNWGQSVAANQGELNGAPPVDGLDLGILLGYWNLQTELVTSVPEPPACWLFLISLFSTLFIGR